MTAAERVGDREMSERVGSDDRWPGDVAGRGKPFSKKKDPEGMQAVHMGQRNFGCKKAGCAAICAG